MQIRTCGLPIFLIVVSLPFLGGCEKSDCPPGPTKAGSPCSYRLAPAKVGSSDRLEFKDETTGGLGGDATGELYKRGTESVVVGWEHFFDKVDAGGVTAGSDLRIYNHIYRGAVLFNVGLLSDSPKKTVTNATLNYTIQTGAKFPTPSGGFIESCATKLLLATDDWHGIPEVDISKAPDTISGAEPPYKDGLSESPPGSVISIDVTGAVTDWVAGKKKNFGFVFAGSQEEHGLLKDNKKCWTLLGDFTLSVLYAKP
ncbi:MAG: DNRLRE domain-containing protein [Methylocystis sp.]|nr:DNRLRE domain-containing protein [Methylocystis sp.]